MLFLPADFAGGRLARYAEGWVAENLDTQAYSLTREQIAWLKERGERESRRGASSVLREILDAAMNAERAQKTEAA
jgi:hypothetical protein